MNAAQFIAKWQQVALTESSAAQQHFLDLCEVLGHRKPAEADPKGEWFTFERGAAKQSGGDGWADVWKRNFFGWEYKGKHKDLAAAYQQLLQYREDLENPPLLVVCDMDRIVIHTNFTATVKREITIPLADLGAPGNLEILRALFFEPEKLRPGVTSDEITKEAASRIAALAEVLRARGLDPRDVARFLDRVVFCLFAEDVGLLPPTLFTRILQTTRTEPERFAKLTGELFAAMAHSGDFGLDRIRHFNGNLFDGGGVLDLTRSEIEAVWHAGSLDWAAVNPTIFGTLFERGMDPAKRSQLGAHYTSREDIETLVEPVVMQPLRREWAEARQVFDNLLATGKKHPAGAEKEPTGAALRKARDEAIAQIDAFLNRLAGVKVLDPACGSGNFLYVTLQKLKDLEKEVILHAMARGFSALFPRVGPWQLHGIEISPYAFDLAQMTVWIGYLQWTRANGFGLAEDPVLRAGTSFECKDAILDLTDPENPKEPDWPRVDYIVGNPPFLGNKRMRNELGRGYAEALWRLYGDRLPATSDLCAYWFEKARATVESGSARRAGLLGTTAIKQVGSRRVLERIADTTGFFFAISDREWMLDGASVRIVMAGLGATDGDGLSILDGSPVAHINADLTGGDDLTKMAPLPANAGLCFMGTTKVGAFDFDDDLAQQLLQQPNPHGRPNSDVVRPFRNGSDLVKICSHRWIADFGVDAAQEEASLYEAPFEHIVVHVKPVRQANRRETRARRWWLLGETLPAFRKAVAGIDRYIATARVSKHRVFVWLDAVVLPDSKVIAIADAGDLTLGVLNSRLHLVWAGATSGRHGGERPTYNPTTCFETFPFPRPTPAQGAAIAGAALELNALREAWLNPPQWMREEVLEFPGSADGPWVRYVHDPDARGIGTVRYPRLVPKDAACAEKLAKRTLTNLYNERPAWLHLAHQRLDEVVFATYGWPPDLSDDALLEKLLGLNLERAR